jgi:hypothetical protein
VLRLPGTYPRSLICFASGVHATLLGSCLAACACAPGRTEGSLPGQGQCSTGDPIAGVLSRGRERDLPGSQVIHPVPLPRSRTPAESTIPRLFVGLVDAAPASRTAKASACQLFRGYRAASAPAAYASRMVLPPSMQSSLPAGWLAFTGRASNPLDHTKGFRSHFHSPFLDLSWRYRDELPALHWITSSTRSKIDCGTVNPSALAIFAFKAISNFTGS